jgi:hypothetical protein
MKIWYKFLFLSVFVLAFTGCGKDDDDVEEDDVTTPVAPTDPPYHSLDMKTDDGKVTQLQKHKVGKGIPIVITGDGFVDKDIREGKFREATNNTLDVLFSAHPMKALRDYFDVYEVTAVSYNDFSRLDAILDSTNFKTAFNVDVTINVDPYVTLFEVNPDGEDEQKVVRYAEKAIDDNRLDDATIIVLVNNDFGGGFCSHWSVHFKDSDIPTGCSVAYVSLNDMNANEAKDYYDDISQYQFGRTLLHEFGHAFAKLADEYVSDERKWDDPESGKKSIIVWHNSGYDRNVSPYSDVTKTPWADFAADSRYDFEKLGCYEGGEYQATGVYRATENSIMRAGMFNHYGFNVIARVMFYKRCMNIAYGDSWTFDYEDFVKFDLDKAKAESEEIQELIRRLSSGNSASKRLGAAPRFVDSVIRSRAIKTTK